jgi:hypothetical protein
LVIVGASAAAVSCGNDGKATGGGGMGAGGGGAGGGGAGGGTSQGGGYLLAADLAAQAIAGAAADATELAEATPVGASKPERRAAPKPV